MGLGSAAVVLASNPECGFERDGTVAGYFIFALRFVCGFWRERYLKGWDRFSEGIEKIRDEEGSQIMQKAERAGNVGIRKRMLEFPWQRVGAAGRLICK